MLYVTTPWSCIPQLQPPEVVTFHYKPQYIFTFIQSLHFLLEEVSHCAAGSSPSHQMISTASAHLATNPTTTAIVKLKKVPSNIYSVCMSSLLFLNSPKRNTDFAASK